MKNPHTTLIHTEEGIQTIKTKYFDTLEKLNTMLTDMDTTRNYMGGYLMPMTDANEYKAKAINDQAMQNLIGLTQNYANVHTPLYGDNSEPCHYSMANFLDQVDVLTDPDNVLQMIANGDATPSMVSMYRATYPSTWSDYVGQSIGHVALTDISQEQRANLFGSTGIETSPFYSRAFLETEMAQQGAAQMGQGQMPKQERTRQIPLSQQQSNNFAPATSEQGKGP